jgi:hypothetical protein
MTPREEFEHDMRNLIKAVESIVLDGRPEGYDMLKNIQNSRFFEKWDPKDA